MLKSDPSSALSPSWRSRIAAELQPARLLPALTMGTITGLMEIVLSVSFAALIFSGSLAPFVADGIGLALLGAAVSGTLVALLSSQPGILGGNQDTPAAILVVMATAMAHTLPPESTLVTVLATIALTTLLTGLFQVALGYFKLGSLVRFLPYPVVGGFLAGTGWLLATGAINLMVDFDPLAQPAALFQADVLLRWVPGLLFAGLLLAGLRFSDRAWVFPGIIAAALGLFFVISWLSGYPPAQLRAAGWFLEAEPGGLLLRPFAWTAFGEVAWPAVWAQLPKIGTIMLLSAVALLLNASGIEETARREVSLNRELWAAGMGNVAAGLVGGLVGYQQMGLSALSLQAGAGSRLTGVVMAGVCVLALVGGTAVLALFPKVILGGLLLYLGLSFLKEWVVDSWARLPRVEYGIILFILAVIAGVGFLEGIAVGIIAAVVLFVVAYSRIDVVRYELTGAHAASRVTRSPRARQRLRQMGDCLVVLRLQGFVFFGTADRLLHHVQQRLEADAAGTVRYVALDFQRISGLDSTAIRSLRKLQQHVLARRGTLLIAGTDPGFCDRLARGGLREGVHYFTDLDRALEWYENEVLGQESLAVETADSLLHQLTALLPAEIEPATLLRYLERREIAPGDVLLRQGEAPDSLFFVESGQVTAQLVYADRPAMRLETMGGGRVVGELGFYLGQVRTASVVADTPGTVYRLTRAALARMEQETPAAAAALHRLIVQLLAERVTHLVNSVDALARWP